ncbi:hypothetical protein NQ315_000566 [Exocentrus adspersus]|uniref:Uncharacterized protein n=1 Tax=Exocentrus adspersus TaxID=1586481 RepID=A0AAV8VFV6_9CUCU|nr:hypothetical protein NQ315_000566 [Exocentrus adspersus]
MEHPCHLEGMLDRDQRTAKMRFYNNSDITEQVPKTYNIVMNEPTPSTRRKHRCCFPDRTKPFISTNTSTSSHVSHKNGYLISTFQSVRSVLIVGACLVALIPSTTSAPITKCMASNEFWINPCQLPEQSSSVENADPTNISKTDLQNIAHQASLALQQAQSFKHSFANEVFKKEFYDLHSDLKSQKLEWLKLQLPKSLEDQVPCEHLKSLKVDEALLESYASLQMIAVGLQQMVCDLEAHDEPFLTEFTEATGQLKTVLCELQETIVGSGIKMRPDVTKDILKGSDKDSDRTFRKNRDWMIYRDYMNILEYTSTIFNYLGNNSSALGTDEKACLDNNQVS